ncbi:hypothetical protein NDU88_003773, partial [Pleurodeles waltl]
VMMQNSGARLPLSNKSSMFKRGQAPCHRITFLQGLLWMKRAGIWMESLKSSPAKGSPLVLRTARPLRRDPQAGKTM